MNGGRRKRTAEEKYNAHDLLGALFDHSRDGILIVDSRQQILDVNPAGSTMLGYARAELCKLKFPDLALPENTDQLNLSEVEAGRPAMRSCRLRHKDGSILSCKVEARVLSENNFILAIFNPSAPESEAHQELFNRNHLDEIVNRSPAIAFTRLAEDHWSVKFVSENIKQFGFAPLDFYSGRVTFADLVHPDDRKRVSAEVKEYSDKGLNEFAQEYRLVTASGEIRWVDDRTWIHRESDGRIGYYQGIILDITQKKKIEEALLRSRSMLETVLDTIPVRVFWKDLDSNYLGCNRPFANDSGLDSPEELIGKNDFQTGWKDQAEFYRADDRAVMESGLPKLRYEEPQTTPDGSTIWLRTSKIPLQDVDGKTIGVLGTYEDITDLKEVEAALQES
jgi:PAS domain S-box-containing protein